MAAIPMLDVSRPLWQTAVYFAAMVGVLVFANWGKPEGTTGAWFTIYSAKWMITTAISVGFAVILIAWFGMKSSRVILAALPAIVLALLFRE